MAAHKIEGVTLGPSHFFLVRIPEISLFPSAQLSGFMDYINPHKMDKWLKKTPANKPCIEDNTNNI